MVDGGNTNDSVKKTDGFKTAGLSVCGNRASPTTTPRSFDAPVRDVPDKEHFAWQF